VPQLHGVARVPRGCPTRAAVLLPPAAARAARRRPRRPPPPAACAPSLSSGATPPRCFPAAHRALMVPHLHGAARVPRGCPPRAAVLLPPAAH
jgi:hypothetical protein